ncbi:sialic acid-binding periplasmic protein SiaP [Desulfolithobacter dissulfuricans]|uniref:Sialic acid-binding periplasmic protein SiaP n=1 Tax=Desulfolithobacter dissulfuricans TaxID=2795293 RepID=A0A915U2C3_9BACT|nr:TRAP transporter substrate-binding protein DctP [Desulfolithobacter dissulfuricans]BCO09909.1 sialic acid-binding periplasmic protein SiaP [Desulfolithobacter dissulfuricans]
MYCCKRNFQLLAFLFCALLICSQAQARTKYLFKVATIAPEGSIWTKRFHDFAAEVEEKSNGEVGFKVYPGGIMGDDRAMYRKMRIGQLHGGGFTMTGIGTVVPDFRVMGIPFLFRSYEEVDHVMEGLWPFFSKAFAAKGLELIAMTEVGFVYSMSISPVSTLSELKKSKIWAPEGDPVSIAYLETLGITPLPLGIPDVLTSLQTGMVETVFNSLYGAIVLQWFTKTKYISDIPFAYAYGCLLLDRKRFARLPESYRSMIKETARKHFSLLITDTRKSNSDSRQVLQDNGISMVLPDPGDVEDLRNMREETVQRVQGTAFSPQIYKTTMKLLDDYRNQAYKRK